MIQLTPIDALRPGDMVLARLHDGKSLLGLFEYTYRAESGRWYLSLSRGMYEISLPVEAVRSVKCVHRKGGDVELDPC